jgi:hypothetical protein
MPTIGQLPPASSVSDSDLVAIFQNEQTLAATRAQFLAGTQTALTLPPNSLLGNAATGTAAPGPITVGANLTLTGNTLSAAAVPFQIAGLTTGAVPQAADVVPLGQSGQNVGVSYANFLEGLANVPGIPGGALTAKATGATTVRTINALAANAVSIEDFGAAGDGVTDDSAALLAAVGSGFPVRLQAKTYAIAGECDITGTTCTILGVSGLSVLLRSAQSRLGSAATATWISVSSTNFFADGVIFDANTAVTANTYAVAIQSSCTKSLITRCLFRNAMGSGNGSGLTYQPSDPKITQHHVDDCEFAANAVNGLYAFAVDALSITNCRAHDNANNGICVNSMDTTFTLKIRNLQIVSNTCWNNGVGIIVGNFVANNVGAQPFLYGNANPDVLGAVIASNNCYSNVDYGIYISGRNILVSGNLCANNSSIGSFGAGILCDTGYCTVSGNMITGAAPFGIDCGGSIYTNVDDNYINGAVVGLNIGGGQNCRARSNFIQDSTAVSISVQNVEGDGTGDNFGLACTDLQIVGNWISYSGSTFGIVVRDAAQNLLVEDNIIFVSAGGNVINAISAYTDNIIVRGNLLNFTTRWAVNPVLVNGVYTLTVPDIADAVSISQSTAPITSMVTAQAALTAGQVTFIKITNTGLAYTHATVTITGTGTGAAATALIYGGRVVGVQMTSFGSGYGAGTAVTITGDGVGVAATVQVGLAPWLNKELSVDCLTNVTFAAAGSSPVQSNWTGAPITVPANATIDWIGRGTSGWRATRFSQNDYISPNGNGSLTIKTQSGDISLHPAGSGAVRIISDAETTGAVELIGRGSPLNAVSAPAGSTFRNLNGGVGTTFWVKQSGTGSSNWVAVA